MNDDLLCRWGLVVDERNLPVFWRLGSPKIAECWRHVDLPADDQIMIDHVRVTEAAGSVVTLDTITAVANRIGDMTKGLNRDRLRYLSKGGKVRACRQDPHTGTKFYRLGDVMHAHNDKTKRRRPNG